MTLLALFGFLMICIFMFLIMTKRMSAMVALLLVPIAFGVLVAILGLADVSAMSKDLKSSVIQAAPTAIMLCFAILYFGTMIDAGLFDPLINIILKAVKGDPLKVALGTCLLTTIVSLDGDGATTYLTTCSALLIVHRQLGINRAMLPTCAPARLGS